MQSPSVYLRYEFDARTAHRRATGHVVIHWSSVSDDLLFRCGWMHSHNESRLMRLALLEEEGRTIRFSEYGLDAIAHDPVTGVYHGIQVKYRSEGSRLRAKDLGTFFSVILNRFLSRDASSRGFLYTNAKLEANLRHDIDNSSFIHEVRLPPSGVVPAVSATPFVLRPYQQEALDVLTKGWIGFGSLIMPCGTGKTLVFGLHAISYRRVVVLSPLRVSARQNLERLRSLTPCADEWMTLLIDSDGGDATRDPDYIGSVWRNNPHKVLLSATYKSMDVLQQFIAKGSFGPDVLVIVDEAHNATEGMLEMIVGCPRVLLATATPPKTLLRDDDSDGEGESVLDDCWGKEPLFHYTFADAIRDKHIADYKIYLPMIEGEYSDEMEAKARFLMDGMMRKDAQRCIVYCTTQEECDRFLQALQGAASFHGIAGDSLWTAKLTCEVSGARREQILEFFDSESRPEVLRVIASVRILDEAIDLPRCDSVLILNPSDNPSSWRRTIQRMSRAIRLDVTKPDKVARVLIWWTSLVDVPACFRILKEQDPQFIGKIRLHSSSLYETKDREESASVLQRELEGGLKTHNAYSVKCLSTAEMKEIKIDMIIKYCNNHEGKPPYTKYIDEASGFKIGVYALCVRTGHTSVTDNIRARLVAACPTFFDVRKRSKVALELTPSQKVDMIIQYCKDHDGKRPQRSYIDKASGLLLGKCTYSLRTGHAKISDDDRVRLISVCPTFFDVRKTTSAALELNSSQKNDMIIQYYNQHNRQPVRTYIDKATGFKLGCYAKNLRGGRINITDVDRARLVEACPTFFEKQSLKRKALSRVSHSEVNKRRK